MKVLVADDEPLAARRLIMELSRRGDTEVVGPYSHGAAARAGIIETKPDVALLDVQMPGSNGFDALEGLLPEQLPLVIFTTAFPRYAVAAFQSGAIDYLLKPIDTDALDTALEKARIRLQEKSAELRTHELRALLAQMRADADRKTHYETFFWVKSAKSNVRVSVHDIEVLEAARDYVMIHTSGRSFLMRGKISEIAERLDPERFVRVHRSYIANLDYVRSFRPNASGSKVITLVSGRSIPVGRTYASEVARHL